MHNSIFTGNYTARIPGTRSLFYGYRHHVKSGSNNDLEGNTMSNDSQKYPTLSSRVYILSGSVFTATAPQTRLFA
ncbi:TPA: hypothetical protein HNC95_21445 [Escherichia coli]|nr:hypothetical protein EOV66_26490 [Escherichia coli]HAJ6753281.1 hypothetical protein [Escherichia coli]